MFNLSSYITRVGLIWKQGAGLSETGSVSKSSGVNRADKTGKAGKAKEADKESVARQTSRVQRPSPTLSGIVDAASRGISSSTAENYRTAVRSFIRFNGGRDVPLSALNADVVHCYERWLREQGVCPNTSSCYMRSLRAIYNKAVRKRAISNKAPFKGVFTGNESTVKRSVGMKEIRRLVLSSFSPPYGTGREIALASDLFLFSFYAMGIPFVDLAHLRRSQIKDGVLTYSRRKTGRQVRVKLEKCMLDILAKYETKESEYLFPILYKVKDRSVQTVSYFSALNRYNRSLKHLACRAGISANLTSYVARHSWASIAYCSNIGLPVISKALGHTDIQTTLIYISEIDDKRLAEANRTILGKII